MNTSTVLITGAAGNLGGLLASYILGKEFALVTEIKI